MVPKRLILGQNRDFSQNLKISEISAAIIGLVGAELAPNFFLNYKPFFVSPKKFSCSDDFFIKNYEMCQGV